MNFASHFNLILSLGFCLVAYGAAGYVIKYLLQMDRLTISVAFFVGAGFISSGTLFIAMLYPESLYIASLILMTACIATALILLSSQLLKSRDDYNFKEYASVHLVLILMVLPLLIGTANLGLWGDEFNMEAPTVRHWLESGNFLIDPDAFFSLYGWPKLWTIILYQSLFVKNIMHEAAGRWLSIIIILFGAAFIWNEYWQYLKLNKWTSLLWASFWMLLVIGPMFAWSASWYYSIIISILVMLSFYYIIVARKDDYLDLKFVVIAAIFMAMIVSIRPDGFTYLPVGLLLLFIAPIQHLRSKLKQNIIAGFILLLPSVFIYFSYRYYLDVNNLYVPGPHNASPLVAASHVNQLMEKFLPVVVEMFRLTIAEWYQTGILFSSVIICSVLGVITYKSLNSTERRMLLILALPLYKFIYLVFANSMYLTRVRMGRHMMQTAPIIYFLLGFLVIKLLDMRFKHLAVQRTPRFWIMSFSCLFVVIYGLQIVLATLFFHLPSDMNKTMQHWATRIKKEYPEYKRVQLIYSKKAPPSTRLQPTWRYYATATPSIYAPPQIYDEDAYLNKHILDRAEYIQTLHDNAVDAVLIYGADKEISSVFNLNLSREKIYLCELSKNGLEIVSSEKIPYNDIWVVPWRKKAIANLTRRVNELISFLIPFRVSTS